MSELKVTKTYKSTDNGMVHDGYFIREDNHSLHWIAKHKFKTLYKNLTREK